jgi:hypothetical protein
MEISNLPAASSRAAASSDKPGRSRPQKRKRLRNAAVSLSRGSAAIYFVTLIDFDAWFPAKSCACTVTVCAPAALFRVFHL